MLYLSGRFLFFCVFIFLASVETFASNQIFFYVPEPVELNGKLERQTFPGLPNYESILSGDAPERGLYLRLEKPIDVIARKKDDDSNAQDEKNVKIVQLAIVSKDPEVEKLLENSPKGTRFTLVGHLFHRLTGHHHARILLEVEQIKK